MLWKVTVWSITFFRRQTQLMIKFLIKMLCSRDPTSFSCMPKRVNTWIVYCTGGLASWSHKDVCTKHVRQGNPPMLRGRVLTAHVAQSTNGFQYLEQEAYETIDPSDLATQLRLANINRPVYDDVVNVCSCESMLFLLATLINDI